MSEESTKSKSIFAALAAKFTRSGASRHFYICGGPDCCTREQGIESFNHLKSAIKKSGLDSGERRVSCTKTGCMNVCGDGPIGVIYPEKRWYRALTPKVIDQIVREDLVNDKPVEEFVFTPPPEAKAP